MADIHALAFNAVTAALADAGRFASLSDREAVAAAVEAAIETEVRADERERVAREILGHKTGCGEHPMPFPKPSCRKCARDAVLHKAARVALGIPYPAALPEPLDYS